MGVDNRSEAYWILEPYSNRLSGLSGPKGSGVNSASGLFKQLLSGAGKVKAVL
ncbi:hypothetical protein ACEQPO_13075 [Bacillus sp. SL00103]